MSTEHSTAKRLVAVRVLILAAFAALLLYGSTDLPYRGDAGNMMNSDESITGTAVPGNYYVREAYHDAHTPNMVTVILGDYRSVDTLGEQVVVFTAGLICLLLLRRIGGGDDDGPVRADTGNGGNGGTGDGGNNRGGEGGPDSSNDDENQGRSV